MIVKNGSWYSSFNDAEITKLQSVVTVISSSNNTFGGGWGLHSTMYLESWRNDAVYPEMNRIDLGETGGWVHIDDIPVQFIDNGNIMSTELPKTNRDNTPAGGNGAKDTHHISWVIDSIATARLRHAVRTFQGKARNHRYRYLKAGGFLGAIFSRPTCRAINCADFVIKVLREAGIANIPTQFINTPYNTVEGLY